MKKILASAFLLVFLFSCKTEDELPTPSPSPGNANVPAEAVGQWLYGSFSMTEFWGYDGSYQGNAFELSVAFDFRADGTYEEYFISNANNYGCITSALSYYKGTVSFTDTSFTLYPQEGNFRGIYSCTPSYNFDRDATQSELTVQTLYYTIETDEFGKTWMVVRFEPTDEYPSYFAPINW